jgi:hypothetical protein
VRPQHKCARLHVQGDPGPRLLQVATLLTAAARLSRDPSVAAMAAAVTQGLMFTSVCRGFISGQGHPLVEDASTPTGSAEVSSALATTSRAWHHLSC